jgi:sec-independent protein translocase protein TatC
MRLGGHLRELRKRLYWIALFILSGSVVGWIGFDPVFASLQAPVVELAKNPKFNATINFGSVVSAFDLRLQVSMFIGVVITSPLWLMQLWLFVSPALKRKEKRHTVGFIATATPLFLAGCVLGWFIMPEFVTTMLAFTPEGSANVINASEYILFTLRILLVFGIAFILPVVLVFMNFLGVVSAKSIRKSWRLAIFISVLMAALATPVSDPMSMFLVAIPLIVFYCVASFIAYLHDRRLTKRTVDLETIRPLEEL